MPQNTGAGKAGVYDPGHKMDGDYVPKEH